MLKQLSISDFILIDEVGLEFGAGFTVLTGETGAGKSIVVSALELLLGGRGDSALVRRGAERARLEAVFDVGPRTREALLAEGFDAGEDVGLRREISREGRSRCYINNRPATVSQLAAVTSSLVELHGQFADLPSLNRSAATEILDDYAGLGGERAKYEGAYRHCLKLVEERRALREARAQRDVVLDGLAFMIKELEEAALEEDEEDRLRDVRNRARYAARISADVGGALAALSEDETSAAARLAAARRFVVDLSEVFPQAGELIAKIDEVATELDEVTRAVMLYRPAEEEETPDLDAVEARLAHLERLKRKYDLDVRGLIGHLAALRERRDALLGATDKLAALEGEIRDAATEARSAAARLTAARAGAGAELQREVTAQLPRLGMEGGRFEVVLTPVEAKGEDELRGLGPGGAEEAAFTFTANPGEPLRPLAKVASGGELSRVMLAVKAAAAGRAGAETVVFDEIDTGVGGTVGHAVGERLREVAQGRQVICVTHLAQIAARADVQYHVAKVLTEGRATVRVAAVKGEERAAEIARMLGGGQPPTAVTLKHARELLAGVRARETARARGAAL